MKRTWMMLATAGVVLSGCRRSAEPERTLFVSGRIDGDTVDISSKVAGQIVDLKVREGDAVEAGKTVAWLSSPREEAIRDAQKARIVSDERVLNQLKKQLATYTEGTRQALLSADQAESGAPKQVKQAEANAAVSEADLGDWDTELQQVQIGAERYPPRAKTGAVAAQVSEQYQTKEQVTLLSVEGRRKQVAASEAAHQRALAQMQNIPIQTANRITLERQEDELKEQIASAEANLVANEAALRKIEAHLSDLTIHAPITGTILTRSAEPGRLVQPGQTILTVVDLTKLYLRGFVPEGSVGRLKVGQIAEVFLDSKPNEAILADVIRIDPEAMFTPQNTYFKEDRVKQVLGLKLALRGAYGYAKPGMPADGRIQIRTRTQTQALARRP